MKLFSIEIVRRDYIETLHYKLQLKQEQINQLTSDNGTLRTKLANMKAAYHDTVEAHNIEVHRLSGEVARLSEVNMGLSNEVNTLNEEIRKLENQVKTISSIANMHAEHLETLNTKLRSANAQLGAYRSKFGEFPNSRESRRNKNKSK